MTQETWEERFDELWNLSFDRDGEIDPMGFKMLKDFIRTELQKAREEEREKLPEILTKYSEYLSEHGYMDGDWRRYWEEPNTVEDFLKDKPRR
jgi:dsDNA-specific endonuclease/ATPase MutS2